jgi:hypothetical protein
MEEKESPDRTLPTKALLRWAGQFNDHLNVCAYCRRNPFDLCREGEAILRMMPTD